MIPRGTATYGFECICNNFRLQAFFYVFRKHACILLSRNYCLIYHHLNQLTPKGIVHSKIKSNHLLARRVIPNLYDFHPSVELKRRYFGECFWSLGSLGSKTFPKDHKGSVNLINITQEPTTSNMAAQTPNAMM